MAENANTIWADGPSGAPYMPDKSRIRAWGTWLESLAESASAQFDAVSTFVAAKIDDTIDYVRTAGYGIAGDGGDALYTKLGAAPVVVKPWHKQSADGAWWLLSVPYSAPRLFGAVGNGSASDTVAMQAALDFAGAFGLDLRLGVGRFRITAALSAPATLIYGEGSGLTVLIFDGLSGANGIVFGASTGYGRAIGIIGATIQVLTSNGGTAISTVKQADQYDTFGVTQIFRDLVLGVPATSGAFLIPAFGFDVWLDLGDSLGTVVENVQANGRYDYSQNPSGQPNDTFLKLSAASAILTARIKNCFTRRTYRGIELGDRVFFFIENCDIASAYDGIIETATTPYGEGWIRGVNINAQHKGIYLSGADGRQVGGCTVRRHDSGWRGATYDWFGIEVANGQLASIKDVLLHISEGSGAFTGLHYGIQMTNINAALVEGVRHSAGLDFIARFSNVNGGSLSDVTSLNSAVLLRLTDASTNIDIGPASRKAGTTLGVTYQAGVDLSTIRDRSEGYAMRGGTGPGVVVTIASDAVSPTSDNLIVNTEASAASDNLSTINYSGVYADGAEITIRAQSSSRDVVVKHGTGNIRLNGAVDFTLDSAFDFLKLKLDTGFWYEIGRGNNGT